MAVTTSLSLGARFRSLTESRLDRNAYAFIASALITSGFGLLYWALAERWYTTDEIGKATAVLAAMTLLANFGQLNLQTALIRVLPRFGRRRHHIVAKAYAVAATGSAVTASVFLIGQPWWSPRLEGLRSGTIAPIGFVLLVMMWSVFVLQDSALAGLHRGDVALSENVAFAVGKIVALAAGVAVMHRVSPIVSWAVPLLAAIVIVNTKLFRRDVGYLHAGTAKNEGEQTEETESPPSVRDLVRLSIPDYLSSLLWMATSNALPLVVLHRLGATASAQYYLGWTLAYGLYLVSSNAYLALLAEGSEHPENIRALTIRARKRVALVIVPGALVACLAIPLVLRLFGRDYSSAVTGIRWMLLSAVPNVIVGARITVLRIRRSVGSLILLQAGACAAVLVFALALMSRFGVTGVGFAWFAGQSIAALYALVEEYRDRKQYEVPPYIDEILPGAVLIPNGRRGLVVASGVLAGAPMIIKLAPASQARRIATQVEAQQVVRTVNCVALRGLVPAATRTTLPGGAEYLLENQMDGVSGDTLIAKGLHSSWLVPAIEAAVTPLYLATAVATPDDVEQGRDWVSNPIEILRASRIASSSPRRLAALDTLELRLVNTLTNSPLIRSRIHGDLAPMNVLVDVASRRVTGVIDWERSRCDGSPAIELTYLRLSDAGLRRSENIGAIVTSELRAGVINPALVSSSMNPIAADELLLLAWLQHVSSNLDKDPRYARAPLWRRRTVYSVLDQLARTR